jgi:hypothetical protein
MSNNKHYTNIKCMNTAKGSYNRRSQRYEYERDENNSIVYTRSLLVTFVGTDDKFECPQTLNSSRLTKWKEAKASLQLVDGTDYILSEDSINEFPSTDTKPQAVSATYRPAAVFVE